MQASAQEFLGAPGFMQPDAHARELHKQTLAAEVLRTTGTVRLAALGYSMLPTLWPGDLLTIEAKSFDQVQVGDVVLFAREDRFFIHRILCKKDLEGRTYLVARGDAMPEADMPVYPGELLGKAISVEYDDETFAIPACSGLRRQVGLLLAHSDRLRSLALRCHDWRERTRRTNLPSREVRLG
jgi:hypothetical protein